MTAQFSGKVKQLENKRKKHDKKTNKDLVLSEM